MTDEERQALQTAILTICDPRGNWQYGWRIICHLARIDPAAYPAPFPQRTEEQLRELAQGTWTPPTPRIPPPKDN